MWLETLLYCLQGNHWVILAPQPDWTLCGQMLHLIFIWDPHGTCQTAEHIGFSNNAYRYLMPWWYGMMECCKGRSSDSFIMSLVTDSAANETVGLSQGSPAEKPNVQCFGPSLESNNVTYAQKRNVILNWIDLFTCLSPCKLPRVKDQVFYFWILGK